MEALQQITLKTLHVYTSVCAWVLACTHVQKEKSQFFKNEHSIEIWLFTCSRWYRAADILCTRSTFFSGSVGPSLFKMSLYRFSCHFTAGSSDWNPTHFICELLNEGTEFDQHHFYSHSIMKKGINTPNFCPLSDQINIC